MTTASTTTTVPTTRTTAKPTTIATTTTKPTTTTKTTTNPTTTTKTTIQSTTTKPIPTTSYVIRLLPGSCDFNKDMCHYTGSKVGIYWERKSGSTGYGRYKIPGDHSSAGRGITSAKV